MSSATDIRAQSGARLSSAEILGNARDVAIRVREKDLAAEYDRLRRLPDDIVAEVRAAGVMRMNMPKIWGGPAAAGDLWVGSSAPARAREDRGDGRPLSNPRSDDVSRQRIPGVSDFVGE